MHLLISVLRMQWYQVAVYEKEDHIKNCNSSYKKDYLRLIVLHHLTLTHDILLNLEFYTIFCMCKEENSISMTWIKKNCQRNHLDLFIDLYHQYRSLFIETETITFYVKAPVLHRRTKVKKEKKRKKNKDNYPFFLEFGRTKSRESNIHFWIVEGNVSMRL